MINDIAIPVRVAGLGSQPVETDGAELDILQLPSGMDSYSAPLLPEPETVRELQPALGLLQRLRSALGRHSADEASWRVGLDGLDADNLALVDQVLGEGEVSVLYDGGPDAPGHARIQESVLAGVWRVRRHGGDGALLEDVIEVGTIPALVTDSAFGAARRRVEMPSGGVPEGVLNAPPVLAEIDDKVADASTGAAPHVINLTLLPQTEQDLAFLEERLGLGRVTILSRGYGNCRIDSTATNNVWWVRYFNSQDRIILNSLEITSVPGVACAAAEDIRDSSGRLGEILDIYR
jgi:hydrogenase-1 operon protein HyaF